MEDYIWWHIEMLNDNSVAGEVFIEKWNLLMGIDCSERTIAAYSLFAREKLSEKEDREKNKKQTSRRNCFFSADWYDEYMMAQAQPEKRRIDELLAPLKADKAAWEASLTEEETKK